MDQTSLTALLQQLQGLDPPEEGELVATGKEQEDDGVRTEPSQEPLLHPAFEGHHAAPTSANDGESELEKLLNSLKPILPDASTSSHVPQPDHTYYPSNECYEDDSYAPMDAFPPVETEYHSSNANTTDMRKYTFTQALPVLSRLATDPDFLDKLQQLKSSQEAFELSVLDERNRAKADLEKQLKRAQDGAEASGVTYEVERIKKLLVSTLSKFDKDALQKWDALARDQQSRLEKMGVPCFYVLKNPDPVAQERQRRVMETLVTLLEES